MLPLGMSDSRRQNYRRFQELRQRRTIGIIVVLKSDLVKRNRV